MQFTEEMESQIHPVNCIGFIRDLEPDWADAILTGPSVTDLDRPHKRERRWMIRLARALKPGGVLMLLGPPGWCKGQRHVLERVGFTVACVTMVMHANHSGREVLVASLGDVELPKLPDPWNLSCSYVEWGSGAPVEECLALIEKYTGPDDLVFDPFAGRGTTAVACERTGRRWVGCEVEPGRAQDAMRRIEEDRLSLR
jgi:hypothetical protein